MIFCQYIIYKSIVMCHSFLALVRKYFEPKRSLSDYIVAKWIEKCDVHTFD